MLRKSNQKQEKTGQKKISNFQIIEKFEEIQSKKRQPLLVHRANIRAQGVVHMKRREGKNYSRDERGRFVFGEIMSQKISPKPGKNKRKKKENVISGDPSKNQLKIGI